MKKLTILVSTLLLTLTLYCVKTTAQTQGMYDVNVPLGTYLLAPFQTRHAQIGLQTDLYYALILAFCLDILRGWYGISNLDIYKKNY